MTDTRYSFDHRTDFAEFGSGFVVALGDSFDQTLREIDLPYFELQPDKGQGLYGGWREAG